MLGQTQLRISPTGAIYICDVENTTIGHVDAGPLRNIWASPRAHEVRQSIKSCRRPCAALCHLSPGLLERAQTFIHYAREGRL